jgi:CBS domain-containing protein/RNA polymerase-binding transcription factor DksA
MAVSVKNWMSGDPVAVGPGGSALEALDLLVERGIRHLPVIDAGSRVVGVVSVDDLRAAMPFAVGVKAGLSPAERETAREWRVSDVMTHAPETITEEATLAEAAQKMADRRIGCLPIVDGEGRLTGILSETDLLNALVTSLWSDRVRERRAKRSELEVLVDGLRHEREGITERLDGYHGVEQELSADLHDRPTDASERAYDQREVDLAERLDGLAARRLEAIDRALDHAAQGRLGVCDRCGGVIPLARLRALPGTTSCVACARAAEGGAEWEPPFERVPGGRAETGRPELGGLVYTRFGEGQLIRIAPFGSCRRCGELEGGYDADGGGVLCGFEGCGELLEDVQERAIVQVGEREVYVEPGELRSVDPAPYD